jgi:hypothetical protein
MSAVRQMLPWIWTALIGTAGVAVLLFGLIPSDTEDLVAVMAVAMLILITALGSVISARQPGNRIAWLLHAISVGLLLSMASSLATESDKPVSPDFWDYAAIVIINGLSLSFLYPIFLILFIFPTGRFLTRRWRWAGWIGVLSIPAMLLVALFTEEVGQIWAEEPWRIPNPIGFLPFDTVKYMSWAWQTALIVLAVGGVAALIVRYRRSDVVVRTQIKWVLYAAVVVAVTFPFAFGDDPTVSGLLYVIVVGAIPVAITVAVTRYKLFEIDRIISRTVSYALVVGLLVAVFFGLVTLVTEVLPPDSSDLAIAASTLAVAALFNPLRKRVQHAVDRRFNRSSYQAARVSEQFAARLDQPHTVEEIAELWKQTVNESLQPHSSGLWLTPTHND